MVKKCINLITLVILNNVNCKILIFKTKMILIKQATTAANKTTCLSLFISHTMITSIKPPCLSSTLQKHIQEEGRFGSIQNNAFIIIWHNRTTEEFL